MRGRSATLLLISPGQIHDEGDIGRTLQQLFQYGAVKHDVPVEHDSPALHLAFRRENGEQLSGVVIPNIGQRDGFLLIATDDCDFLDVGLIERADGPLEDGFAFDIQQTLGFVLDQRKQLLFKSRRWNDGRDFFAADRKKGLLILLHLRHTYDVIHFRQGDDAIIGCAWAGVFSYEGQCLFYGPNGGPDRLIGVDDDLRTRLLHVL